MSRVTKYGYILLAVVLLIKASLFLWGYAQFDFVAHPTDTALSIWDRWDATAYKTIATQGYSATGLAPDYHAFVSHFPPVYPLVIKVVSLFTFLPVREAGLLVSLVAIMAASFLLYRLVFDVYGDIRLAFVSALLLNLYPTSYFTIAPYTESLFLLLVIGSFYCLNKFPRQSYAAGILGGLAVLTRLLGVAVIPAYVWFVWQKYRHKKPISLSDIALMYIPVIAVIAYLAINKYYYGDPLFFLREYATNPYSSKTTTWPLQETFQSLVAIWQSTIAGEWNVSLMTTTGYNALFTIFALLVTVGGIFKRIRPEWTIFGLSYIVLFSSFHWGISNARYGLAVFPMFIVLATIKNKYVLALILISFVLLLLYFTGVYTSGAWAF